MKNKEDFQEIKKKHLDRSAANARRSFTANDESIHEILMKVLAKWRAGRTAEHDAEQEQEEWRETVVLSAGERKGDAAVSPKKEGEALTETVIITPSEKGRESARSLMRPLPKDRESLDETVALREGKRGALQKKDIRKTPDHTILAETVIVKPGKKRTNEKRQKNHSAILETLADEIRLIYQADRQRAGPLIETYLEQRLNEYLPDEKMAMLEELAARFKPVAQNQDHCAPAASKDLLQLYSMLLGRKIVDADLTSSEITKRLGMSLNTIFDSVNTIIAVIRSTLLGEKTELQTIREIIDFHLGSEGGCETLQSYLDQIKNAFLLAHRAFQETARIKIAQILDELSPDRIAESMDKSLKFGPLHRAELFDQYKKRYLECKKWFESDRFTQELLREFENICQRSYKN